MKKGIDVSDGDQKESILQMLGEKVLNNLAVRVVVDRSDEIEEDSEMHTFIEELRELPSCHFVS